MSALDWIASRELIESCTSQANVFSGRDDLAEGAFVSGIIVLISGSAPGCYAKAGVGGKTCLVLSIASSISDVASRHGLLQNSWSPSIDL